MNTTYNLHYILKTVSNYYGLSAFELIEKNREAKVNQARQVFCFFARKYSGRSFPKIGEVINRDHATVLHAVNKIESERVYYKQLEKDLNEIEILLFNVMIPANIDLLQMSINYTKSFIGNY